MPILPDDRSSPVKITHQRTPSKALTMPPKIFNKPTINVLNIKNKMISKDNEVDSEIKCFENKINSKNGQLQPKKMKVNRTGLNSNKNMDCEGEKFL